MDEIDRAIAEMEEEIRVAIGKRRSGKADFDQLKADVEMVQAILGDNSIRQQLLGIESDSKSQHEKRKYLTKDGPISVSMTYHDYSGWMLDLEIKPNARLVSRLETMISIESFKDGVFMVKITLAGIPDTFLVTSQTFEKFDNCHRAFGKWLYGNSRNYWRKDHPIYCWKQKMTLLSYMLI